MPTFNNYAPEVRFTRTLLGIIMIGVTFVSWGKWVTMFLGILLLISGLSGFCIQCAWNKHFNKNKTKRRQT